MAVLSILEEQMDEKDKVIQHQEAVIEELRLKVNKQSGNVNHVSKK